LRCRFGGRLMAADLFKEGRTLLVRNGFHRHAFSDDCQDRRSGIAQVYGVSSKAA
jgi:hypothetical protein